MVWPSESFLKFAAQAELGLHRKNLTQQGQAFALEIITVGLMPQGIKP
jgi:hypothetical protein